MQGRQTLPIHFFTIVLNGEPFIRYHEDVFRRLTVPWHWHIVEGVAALRHDTAWSVANGGHIPDDVHDRGRSNDGTTAYLDELAVRFPENVSLYRKPLDRFWAGKREMVNAPLPSIKEPCLLWQIDNDELWTVAQIDTVHALFTRDPARTAAYYWCWYYVAPGKIISTRHNYAQDPAREWLRTWRYAPGAHWVAHEPPILAASSATSGAINCGGIWWARSSSAPSNRSPNPSDRSTTTLRECRPSSPIPVLFPHDRLTHPDDHLPTRWPIHQAGSVFGRPLFRQRHIHIPVDHCSGGRRP